MSTNMDDAREGLEYAADALLKPLAGLSATQGKTDVALIEALQLTYRALALVQFRAATWHVVETASANAETPATVPADALGRLDDDIDRALTQAAERQERAKRQRAGSRHKTAAEDQRPLLPVEAASEAKRRLMEDPPQPLSVPELSHDLGVSDSQIYRWIEEGDVQAEKRGAFYVIPPATVRMLRAIRDTKPANRKSVAQWINKRVGATRGVRPKPSEVGKGK